MRWVTVPVTWSRPLPPTTRRASFSLTTFFKDLFAFFENGAITNIEELAHIIGRKKLSPRGDDDLPLNQRDEYDNIIMLCPDCHTIVDKNPDIFTVEIVREWKMKHEDCIKGLFQVPKFKNRTEARAFVSPLLTENKYLFSTFGPYSENAKTNQLAAELEWDRKSIKSILPNNRLIERVIENNLDLLTSVELEQFVCFKAHREGFEYNKLSADVSSVVPKFPDGFENVFL